MKALIVTAPFASYAKGDQIVDADKIKSVLETNPNEVVAVNLPDPPAPSAPTSSVSSQS
ncbi:hypothetical protein [Rhizobium sp. 60-20]|uniref:hypothetical protein n=1 Tax=Rhizobium sp. 60-20 TaxID=1895819 RepID=UPI000B1B3404|nr:hypothetical protein [Rhizobium sp. 60-20]